MTCLRRCDCRRFDGLSEIGPKMVGVLVHREGDGRGGNNSEQTGRKTLVEASYRFIPKKETTLKPWALPG